MSSEASPKKNCIRIASIGKTISTAIMPTSIFTGILRKNTFTCGATRLIIPKNKSVKSSATKAGAASCKPIEMTLAVIITINSAAGDQPAPNFGKPRAGIKS